MACLPQVLQFSYEQRQTTDISRDFPQSGVGLISVMQHFPKRSWGFLEAL
jgi:hypothetical protein